MFSFLTNMPVMVDDCWKQRVDLESRGKNFTLYWANQHPHLFAPSSLEEIEKDASQNKNDSFRVSARQHFASQRYPNKYMRLQENPPTQYVSEFGPATSTFLARRTLPQRTATPTWGQTYPGYQPQPPLVGAGGPSYSVPQASYPGQRHFSSSWSTPGGPMPQAHPRSINVLGAGGGGLARTAHGMYVAPRPQKQLAGMWGYHSRSQNKLHPMQNRPQPLTEIDRNNYVW